jgi:DNA-binding GntR family transcriptional regulator
VLADEVVDAIRTAIVSGELEAGKRLIEDELASQLQVSRGPVREALARLEQEGLIVNERHDEDLAGIARVLQKFDSLPKPPTRTAVANLDVEFHDAVFRAAHHERLYRAWMALRSQISLFLLQRGALRSDYSTTWRADHEELLAALTSRKRSAAVKLVEVHIEGTYRRVLAMEELQGSE